MTENLSHITSYTDLALFHDLKEEQVPQISNISNRTNKKRKKDNTSGLRNSAKKKTKANNDPHNLASSQLTRLDEPLAKDENDKKYFLTSKNIYNWYNSLNKVKEYINNYKKRPSIHDKDKEIQKLGRWTSLQQTNYKRRKESMKDDNICYEWTEFMNEYQEYFLNICDKWYNSLNKVKEYIDKYKKKPTESDKNEEIQKLGRWINLQQANYKRKKESMKDDKIYYEWSQFMIEYQEYFINICDKWYNSLNKVKEYIDKNKKKPTISDKDKEIQKLRKWINTQQVNYKNEKYNMKDTNIYSKWTQFMKKYQKYM